MKTIIVRCSLLLSLTASAASAAQGLNLRWQQCFGDGGTFSRAFACNTNTGNHLLLGTFELAADLADVSGNEIVIDIASDSPALPPWWQFRNPGTCRQSSLLLNTVISPVSINCLDWSDGQSVGGIGAYFVGLPGQNMARVVAAIAVPPSALAMLVAGQEYFSFNLIINSQKTVGTGACVGCNIPACIVFSSFNLTTPIGANNRRLTGPTNLTDSNFCTWQGGGNPQTPLGQGCPAATPARRSTWGGVKSLYR